MNNIIEIENLTFCYSEPDGSCEIKALDGVNLGIKEGSFTAVIGRNGSGKSTLSKHLNALLLPGEGVVCVGGYDTSDDEHLWEIRQTAGMVFQNPDNQIVSSIVEDDVAFGPENLGIEPAEIRRRVDKALTDVGMGEHKKSAPHMLSGGQKQRIAIAGAIAMKPRCIVFDEPTAMLDPKGRREVMNIIEELHEEGITCILITHFMEEAARAERIIIMDKGSVKLDGSPHEVFAQRDQLKAMSLDVPLTVELSYRLRKYGFSIDKSLVDKEELVDAICRLK